MTPHTGDRWSMVIFLHARAGNLSSDQKLILKKVDFNIEKELSQPVHRTTPTDKRANVVEGGNFSVPESFEGRQGSACKRK